MPKKKGRPAKPKRSRGRPIGSGIKRTDLPDFMRKFWREYYHSHVKKGRKLK